MLFLALFCSAGLWAQLGVGEDAEAILLPIEPTSLVSAGVTVAQGESLSSRNSLFSRAPAPFAFGETSVAPTPFNYGASKPYLAFFCRLELHIEEATRFPVRFRLGEVRSWQQELTKRD